MDKRKEFTDFYEAYHFLEEHALFEGDYSSSLYIEVVKVDPETRCVEDDDSRNTETNIWFEAGAPGCHDLDLDCGGATYEEATIKLANLVLRKYGVEKAKVRGRVCQVMFDEER